MLNNWCECCDCKKTSIVKKIKTVRKTFNTAKSLNFNGTNYRGFTTLDLFLDTLIRGFRIICSITKVNNDLVGL